MTNMVDQSESYYPYGLNPAEAFSAPAYLDEIRRALVRREVYIDGRVKSELLDDVEAVCIEAVDYLQQFTNEAIEFYRALGTESIAIDMARYEMVFEMLVMRFAKVSERLSRKYPVPSVFEPLVDRQPLFRQLYEEHVAVTNLLDSLSEPGEEKEEYPTIILESTLVLYHSSAYLEGLVAAYPYISKSTLKEILVHYLREPEKALDRFCHTLMRLMTDYPDVEQTVLEKAALGRPLDPDTVVQSYREVLDHLVSEYPKVEESLIKKAARRYPCDLMAAINYVAEYAEAAESIVTNNPRIGRATVRQAYLRGASLDDLREGTRYLSDVQIARLIRKLERAPDCPPTYAELKRAGEEGKVPRIDILIERFAPKHVRVPGPLNKGAIEYIVRAAGYVTPLIEASERSVEELSNDVLRLAQALGRAPTIPEMYGAYESGNLFHPDAYLITFSPVSEITYFVERTSYWAMLKALGLAPPPIPRRRVVLSKDEILLEARKLSEILGHGPSIEDWEEAREFFLLSASTTVREKFEGWNKMLRRAGLPEHHRDGKLIET